MSSHQPSRRSRTSGRVTSAAPRSPGRLRNWLVSEMRRSMVAAVVAVVIGPVMVFLVRLATNMSMERLSWLAALIMWIAVAAVHALLTWFAFAGRSGADLAEAAARVNPRRARRRRHTWPLFRAMFVADAPAFSVTMALCALTGVGTLVLDKELSTSMLLVGTGVVLVAVSWLDVVIMYALQYARMDHDAPQPVFAFPGEETERNFADYTYLALGAHATFGTTDVSLLSTRVRRIMSTQTLVAFVYNTVVVAIVVSLLVSSNPGPPAAG